MWSATQEPALEPDVWQEPIEEPEEEPTDTTPPPAQVQAAAISVTGQTWTRDEIIAELGRYDWPIEGAIATIECESRFNQFARNASGARGLFQDINDDPAVDDPAVSIARAYTKWLDGGRSFYRHWTQWGGCGAGY